MVHSFNIYIIRNRSGNNVNLGFFKQNYRGRLNMENCHRLNLITILIICLSSSTPYTKPRLELYGTKTTNASTQPGTARASS